MRTPLPPCTHPPPRGRAAVALAVAAIGAALLAGCASTPRGTSGVFGGAASPERDGPEATPPPGLALVPDAEPKLEPIRAGGPNKPYTVWGQSYVPLTEDVPLNQRGLASWYGRKFNGKPTASGELYNMYAMTAAHPTLPIPSYARIRNLSNGREVVVRINDRGPFHSSRIVDVSYTAALKLDILRGVTPVEIERITADDIRTGAWRHVAPGAPLLAQAAPLPAAAADAPAVIVLAGDVVATSTLPAAEATAPPIPIPTPVPALPPIENGAAARALTAPARGYWIQLGAFRQHDGAVSLQQQVEARVDWLTPLLTVFGEASLFRLQAGPYARREDARDAAERVRSALQLVPLIVERR